jgi:hypothetical protein
MTRLGRLGRQPPILEKKKRPIRKNGPPRYHLEAIYLPIVYVTLIGAGV